MRARGVRCGVLQLCQFTKCLRHLPAGLTAAVVPSKAWRKAKPSWAGPGEYRHFGSLRKGVFGLRPPVLLSAPGRHYFGSGKDALFGLDDDLDPAVVGPALSRLVVGQRAGVPHPNSRGQVGRIPAANQITDHGLRTRLAKLLIVFR